MSEPRVHVADAHDPTDRRRGADRREWPRVPKTALADLKAQLAAGTEIDLKDLSRGGARFQTETRLLPGLTVNLRLVAVDGRITTVRGRVVRSRLLKLDRGGMGYEVGVAFQELITPVIDEMGAHDAGAVADAAPAADVEHASASDSLPVDEFGADLAPLVLIAAVAQSTPELCDLFNGNDW